MIENHWSFSLKFFGVFVKMLLFLVKFAIFLFNYTADVAKIKNKKNSDIFSNLCHETALRIVLYIESTSEKKTLTAILVKPL